MKHINNIFLECQQEENIIRINRINYLIVPLP